MSTPRLLDDPGLAARIRDRDREALATVVDACLDQVVRAARGAGLSQQQALLSREVDGLSTPEICKILGVSSTNLGVMLYRVRNRLRDCLENRWERA